MVKTKKRKGNLVSLYFEVLRKPHTYTNFAVGKYKLRGKELYFQVCDAWFKSDCPLSEFKAGIEAGNIVPVVPEY